MYRIILIGAIGTAVAGATIGGIIYKNKKVSNAPENQKVEQEIDYDDLEDIKDEKPKPKLKTKGTLEDFTSGKLGTNISCYFIHDVGKSDKLEVITYISGNKIRADYYLVSESMGWRNAGSSLSNMHIIHDGTYAFIWGDSFLGEMMQGMKYKLNYNSEGEIEKPNSEMTPEMLDYKLPAVDCRPWTPDNSVFAIPGEISFMNIDEPGDLNGLLEETIEGGDIDIEDLLEKDPDDPCIGCGFMPDSMKADCYAGC